MGEQQEEEGRWRLVTSNIDAISELHRPVEFTVQIISTFELREGIEEGSASLPLAASEGTSKLSHTRGDDGVEGGCPEAMGSAQREPQQLLSIPLEFFVPMVPKHIIKQVVVKDHPRLASRLD